MSVGVFSTQMHKKFAYMKYLLTAVFLITSLPSYADFQAAVDAYEAGNYETAYNVLKPLAEQGNVKAQNYLGQMYHRGEIVPRIGLEDDWFTWAEIEDEKNWAERFLLVDHKEAVKWYRLAAEQGLAEAQHNLAGMYYRGEGVPQDYKEAVKWWRLAAEQGDPKAQHNLGYMYYSRKGVPQDDKEAVKWYRLAAEQGLAEAQHNLAGMYRRGEGVSQDYKEAVKWYRLAAEQGDAKAQAILGVIYENGEGVPQDYAECYAWMSIIVASGYEYAKDRRDECASKLSPEALSKAQEKAKVYWKKYGSN